MVIPKLKNEFPNLSIGIVYRNFATLHEQGLIKKIHFGSTFDLFEANTQPHYHLICESCGKIIDVEMPIYNDLNTQTTKLTSFTIFHHNVEFFGMCEECERK